MVENPIARQNVDPTNGIDYTSHRALVIFTSRCEAEAPEATDDSSCLPSGSTNETLPRCRIAATT